MKICREIAHYDELIENFETPSVNGGAPCYQTHLQNTEELSEDVSVADYLTLLCSSDETMNDCLVTFSVTSEEDRHKEWLEAVEMYPGSHVTAIDRGGYTVYFCTFPVTPQFPE